MADGIGGEDAGGAPSVDAGIALQPRPAIPTCPPRRLHERLLDLVFPPRCVGCAQPGVWICSRCWPQVPWLGDDVCSRCGRSSPAGIVCSPCRVVATKAGAGNLEMRALARHEGIARKAVIELKYTQHWNIATVLGGVMSLRVKESSLLIPVPLHPSRRRSRGFNQSELLAKAIGRHTGMPVVTDRLRRRRKTRDQINLDGSDRKANVAGAFVWTGPRVNGRLLLIDDVATTGATLGACVEALRTAGMTDVEALVFASAPSPRAKVPNP